MKDNSFDILKKFLQVPSILLLMCNLDFPFESPAPAGTWNFITIAIFAKDETGGQAVLNKKFHRKNSRFITQYDSSYKNCGEWMDES